MRNIYQGISIITTLILIQANAIAQCGSSTLIGSASNMFTQIRNGTNPVAAEKNLNTIVFIHRNNASAFGTNSGTLRYDISTNAGSTWTVDQGILDPVNTSLARYPNVAIYNPSLNVNPSNAYLGYLAATIHPTTSAWNGVVSGVRQLNGSGNTENYNQPIVNPQLIPHSVVKGAQGIFWAIDALFNGTYITGFTIYKGTWNGSTDITWANNYNVTPSFNTSYNGIAQIADYNIAFDPTGTIGWFSFLGHVSSGPSGYAYYPVLYKTTNGGSSWSGPYQVDLNQFSCITGNIATNNIPTTNFEHDLTVDVYGNPHVFTTICNGTGAYSVLYASWHHMYDITLVNGLWAAYDVSSVNAGRGTWGTSPNQCSMDMAPQVSRTLDGSKLFFTWSDNSNYALGQANLTPNLFSKAYDVVQNRWTQAKDFTSCNGSIAGKILFPHLAPEVLEPSTNNYLLAEVYGEYTITNDPLQVSNFDFINNLSYAASEFTVTPPSATITIQQASPLLLCPGSTLIINVSNNPGQVLWSTGSTNTLLAISNPTITSYSVVAQQACYVGTASIAVTNLTFNVSVPVNSVCPGSVISLSVTGNANNYNWMPGGMTGTTALVTTTTNPVYTLTAGGSGNCSTTTTLSVNLFQLPTISISGQNSVCLGSSVVQTASGASTYLWSNNAAGASATLSPVVNTTYTVTGTDVNSCVNTQTVSIFVNPLPTLTAISTASVICAGTTISLTASGALTYSWTGLGGNQILASTPSLSTVYTVTGTDANLCSSSKTIGVTVNPLPVLNIVSSRTLHCVGEKSFTLTASGAATYTWSFNNSNTPKVAVNPTTTTTYSVSGTTTAGCVDSFTYSQLVSNCVGLNEPGGSLQPIIYPNPSDGGFSIRTAGDMDLQIINGAGQMVFVLRLDSGNNHEVSVTGLPQGLYFLSGQNDAGVLRQKIVIQK